MTDRPDGMTTVLYRHFDADDRPLYYGISDDPEQRLLHHRSQSMWTGLAARCTEEWFPSRAAAEAAERAAVPLDEPLFNREYNTPGSEQRLVAYLVERGLHDLLAPAWPKNRNVRPQPVVVESAAPNSHFSMAVGESVPYDDEEKVLRLPQHFRSWSRRASIMFLPPGLLRARFALRAEFRRKDPNRADADAYVRQVIDLQGLLNDETRRFEILMGGDLLVAEGDGVEEVLHRVAAATYRPNVRVGCLPHSGVHMSPPDCDIRIFDYVMVQDGFFGEQVEPSGRASRVLSRHLDLLWPDAVTGADLRGLIQLKLAGRLDKWGDPIDGAVKVA